MLEAKAIWEHTCIAGGLLVFFVSFFGSTKNSTSKTGPCPNNEKMEGHPVSRISLHLTCISLQKPLKTLISELFKGFNLHLIQEIISPSALPTFPYCFLKCPFYKAFYAFLNSAFPFYPISLWVETFHFD